MKECISSASSEEVGQLRYYLVDSEDAESESGVLFGVLLEQEKTEFETVRVNGVETDRVRMIEFIRKLAEGQVTCTTLHDVCEDYAVEISEL